MLGRAYNRDGTSPVGQQIHVFVAVGGRLTVAVAQAIRVEDRDCSIMYRVS